MDRRANAFALLDDVETEEDVEKLLATAAAAAAIRAQEPLLPPQAPPSATKFRSNNPPPGRYVRYDKNRGDNDHNPEIHTRRYREQGPENSHQQKVGKEKSYRNYNGDVDRQANAQHNGYNGNRRSNRFGKNRGQYNDQVRPKDVGDGVKPENNGIDRDDDTEWTTVGGRRQNYFGRRNSALISEVKEVSANNEQEDKNSDGAEAAGNDPVTAEITKIEAAEQAIEEEEKREEQMERKEEMTEPKDNEISKTKSDEQRKLEEEMREEAKKMTLVQYEEKLSKVREALEALNKKQVERKVTIDKDLETMKIVGKKKEENASHELKIEKGKKKSEEKARKTMNINDFVGSVRRGRRQGQDRGQVAAAATAPEIGDEFQFPVLIGASLAKTA